MGFFLQEQRRPTAAQEAEGGGDFQQSSPSDDIKWIEEEGADEAGM